MDSGMNPSRNHKQERYGTILLAHPSSRFAGARRNKAAEYSKAARLYQAPPAAYHGDPTGALMQNIAQDIGRERVARVVERFYAQVRQHPRLQAPFARVTDWPHHLEVLTHFWWVSLGGERYLQYPYAVARKHGEAGFTPELLADWLGLFQRTLEAELPPELTGPWLERAQRIGQSLTYMHEHQQLREPDHSLFRRA